MQALMYGYKHAGISLVCSFVQWDERIGNSRTKANAHRPMLIPFYISSVESQKGVIATQKMFCREPERRYCCTKSMAIAPFWFSTEHLWSAIAPFWLSADNIIMCPAEGHDLMRRSAGNASFCEIWHLVQPITDWSFVCLVCWNFIPSKVLSLNIISCNSIYNANRSFKLWEFYRSRSSAGNKQIMHIVSFSAQSAHMFMSFCPPPPPKKKN